MRNPVLRRRAFVQAAGLAALGLALGGCSSETAASPQDGNSNAAESIGETNTDDENPSSPEPSEQPEPTTQPEPASEPAPEPSASGATGAALVAYFSVSGNTAAVAEAIAESTGADLFAITPVQAYTAADTEYNSDSSRTSIERPERDTIVVELEQTTPENWADYDVIYFGFPIWWGAQAWPVNEFLRSNDFAGKTIIPFCTSGSSPIVSASSLEAIAGSGTWVEGARISSASAKDEVDDLIARA